MAAKQLTSDDLLRTFISRRVCPLQTRAHKICHMSGPLDPTRVSRHVLSKEQVAKWVRAIARTNMTDTWEWGVEPFERDHRAPNVSSSGLSQLEVFQFRSIVFLFDISNILPYTSCRDILAKKWRMVRTPPLTGVMTSLLRKREKKIRMTTTMSRSRPLDSPGDPGPRVSNPSELPRQFEIGPRMTTTIVASSTP